MRHLILRSETTTVVIVSPSVSTIDRMTLVMYLATIRRSVETVKEHLPDWIIRLYIDQSLVRFEFEGQTPSTIKMESQHRIIASK